MNKKRLEILLNRRVNAVRASDDALDSLDKFCVETWGMKFHENNGIGDDKIVEWLDYGRANVNVLEFIQFMDKQKTEEKEGIS